ncbi:hypothetical protein SAMN04487880_1881 [Marinobacter sp. es.042]|uniref:DUF5412 family protein n=1 Tax=Marinobacter sp. es.042 TaxID=1761794 RepID=UPI000B50164D|nr:DUF5412 family protein [Marinobacter sp. es.042]SNB56978.1 hypothetical protein SAMN04487880_1881 [Marinobacter sp. es.042]
MKRIKRWMVGVSLTILAVFVAVVLIAYLALPDLCENEELSATASPNGEYEAISFRRNCGATTPYSVQVSVVPAGMELPNEPGNVLVIRNHDLAPELHWKGPYDLGILYPTHVQVIRVDKIPNDVSVVYTPVAG